MVDVMYTRARWFVLLAMVIVTGASLSVCIAAAPLIPTMFMEMNWDPGATVAATMMAYIGFSALAAFTLGFLVDKLGTVRCWIISLIGSILGLVLIPVLAHSLPGLVVCRAFSGAGSGLMLSTIASLCSQWFKYNERTYVAAFQGFAVNLGIGVGLVVSPAMFKLVGDWRMALAYDSILPIIGLIVAIIVFFSIKPPVHHAERQAEAGSVKVSSDLKKAFICPTLYILAAMWLIDAWSQQAYMDIAPAFYAAPYPLGLGFDPQVAGMKLMWASYAMMAGSLAAPVITEIIFKGSAKPTVFIGLGVSAVTVLSVRTLTPDSGMWLIMIPVIILFFSSFVNPTVVGYIAKHYPDTITGRLGGYLTGVGSVGATLGVAVGSMLLHTFNSFIPNMNVLAGLMAMGAVVVLFLKKPKFF